jgi:hypothetical protein
MLSAQERTNTRRALLVLVELTTPTWLAEALGMTVAALQRARSPSRPPTVRLAALVAHAAGVRLADVLSGAWPGDPCPRCGRCGDTTLVVPANSSPTVTDEESRDLASPPPTDRDAVSTGGGGAP